MRGAGVITGLLVLGMFMIPGIYAGNPEGVAPSPTTGGAAATAEERPEHGAAALAGRVFDEGGRPIAGARVSLAGSGFWPSRTVETGPDGRFDWPGIPPGVYELRVSKGRLVAPPVEGLILDSGARRAFALRLARGWVLRGQVLDAGTGLGVEGAEITVATGALGLHSRRTTSDRRGGFSLEGVIGSSQAVYVEADGYVLAGPIVQPVDAPAVTIRLVRAASIEGRVVDRSGRPVSGAFVRAFGEQSSAAVRGGESLGVTSGPVPPITAAGSGQLAFVAQATTGRDGRFALANLRPGSFIVTATHDAFSPGASTPIRVDGGASRTGVLIELREGAELAGRVVDDRGRGLEGIPVELRAEEERLPRMTMTSSDGSFSFRGVRGEVAVAALPYDLPATRETLEMDDDALVTVELALQTSLFTMRGRVVDDRGYGVEGALLTVTSADPKTTVRRTAKSDVDGTFAVPALPAPPFTLRVEHPAFSTAKLPEVDALDDVRIVMTAGVTFLGEVRDEWTGDPLAGALVRLRGPRDVETRTRRDGTFAFRQLPTGTYDVALTHGDYVGQERRVVVEPPLYVDRPQELETIRLAPGGVVEGEVVDADGTPVPDAEVAWGEPPKWDRSVRTDARGAFQLRGVPAGGEWITARHAVAGEGWTSNPVTVRPLEVSPGAMVRLDGSAPE